jgi:hypothetical protein
VRSLLKHAESEPSMAPAVISGATARAFISAFESFEEFYGMGEQESIQAAVMLADFMFSTQSKLVEVQRMYQEVLPAYLKNSRNANYFLEYARWVDIHRDKLAPVFYSLAKESNKDVVNKHLEKLYKSFIGAAPY